MVRFTLFLEEKIENFQNAESKKKVPSTILNLPSVQDADQIITLLRGSVVIFSKVICLLEFRRLIRS